tara:strand:- start:220 stop:369 length:150 start_codon:yes stop_codon:yes gene_type:complete
MTAGGVAIGNIKSLSTEDGMPIGSVVGYIDIGGDRAGDDILAILPMGFS